MSRVVPLMVFNEPDPNIVRAIPFSYECSQYCIQHALDFAHHLRHLLCMAHTEDQHSFACLGDACLCHHPRFKDCLQIILAVGDSPATIDLSTGFRGVLVWSWQWQDAVDLSADDADVRRAPPKDLAINHFSPSCPLSGAFEVRGLEQQREHLDLPVGFFYTFHLCTRNDRWHPSEPPPGHRAGGDPIFCPICQSSDAAPVTETVCGHRFHKSCLDRWLEERPACPTCNNRDLDVLPL